MMPWERWLDDGLRNGRRLPPEADLSALRLAHDALTACDGPETNRKSLQELYRRTASTEGHYAIALFDMGCVPPTELPKFFHGWFPRITERAPHAIALAIQVLGAELRFFSEVRDNQGTDDQFNVVILVLRRQFAGNLPRPYTDWLERITGRTDASNNKALNKLKNRHGLGERSPGRGRGSQASSIVNACLDIEGGGLARRRSDAYAAWLLFRNIERGRVSGVELGRHAVWIRECVRRMLPDTERNAIDLHATDFPDDNSARISVRAWMRAIQKHSLNADPRWIPGRDGGEDPVPRPFLLEMRAAMRDLQ